MDLLARITRDRGMAMVLITHDLGLAARCRGGIAVMEAGPSRSVFDALQAAYTRTLLDAVPHFDPHGHAVSAGQMVNLTHMA